MGDAVLTVSSRALLLACEALGIDFQPILDEAGIERRVMDDPDARLEVRQQRALWERALEISGDPYLALHAAESVPPGATKVIHHLASSAPDDRGLPHQSRTSRDPPLPARTGQLASWYR